MRRLPNLNALRAFEAAARHLSFTKAAQELSVTQGAVSHQVAALEAQLGLPLFERLNRRLRLTEAGRRYLPPLSEAFDRIALATQDLAGEESEGQLRVTVMPSFAQLWLLPRLQRFRQRAPQIDVMVLATENVADFSREPVDLGVRFGFGNYPGLYVERMMGEAILPVCAPSLLSRPPGLKRPEDLIHYALLHDDAGEDHRLIDWAGWLDQAGATEVDPTRGPQFSNSSFVVVSAVAGEGVALAKLRLCVDELIAGRLVQPFGPMVELDRAYWLATTPEKARWPKVRSFMAWLHEEAAAQSSWPPTEAPEGIEP
ncbi:MAG: transcriptional regulator GcvA [Rhodospirillales bacterium]